MEENKNEELDVIPEKKVEQPVNIEPTNDNKEEQVKEEKTKKSVFNIIVWFLLGLMVVCAIVYVFVLKPAYEKEKQEKENNEQSSEILTEARALAIAKEKLDEANNFFGEFYSLIDCSDSYSEMLCFYSTIDEFKNKFYSIYSKDLEFKDVYIDYNDALKDESKRAEIPTDTAYIVSDNKVYIDHGCRASGDFGTIADYVVVSNNENKIEVSYNYKRNLFDGEEVITEEETDSMILVKEDGNWKIRKAAIITDCGSTKKIGK